MHPRESRYGRREFLGRSAVGVVGLSSLSTLLAACGGGNNGEFTPPDAQARDAREPGHATPLRRQSDDRVGSRSRERHRSASTTGTATSIRRSRRDFGKEYGVNVEETFFSTTDEAVAKIASGAIDFDVFFPTTDRIGRLVLGKRLQPLNGSYLPNLAERLAVAPGSRGTTRARSTPFRTSPGRPGSGTATDKVSKTPRDFSNPYEIYWDEANRGKTYLLDDSRDAPAHMLLKNGITNINTENPADIQLAKDELKSLIDAVNIKLSTDDYTNLPGGQGLGAPDVVGKRGLRAVVPARGRRHGRARVTGSPRTGTGRSGAT